MSLRFYIVAEGNTDQAVIQNVLLGYFGSRVSPADIDWVSPRYIEKKAAHSTDRGTWEKVFQYLRAGDYREALQFPGYLIVQIDTDISTHPHFGVPQHEAGTGRKLPTEELVHAVRARLRGEIGEAGWELVSDRILFAIGVHETQCWLAPLTAETARHTATTGCNHAVQKGITDANLRRSFGLKEVGAYDKVSAPFRKRKELMAAAKKQQSLALFLDELARVAQE